MVLHPEACWGGLPTHVQKTKIYNIETGEFASTPPFSKKAFGGSYLKVTFGREIIWREYFKKIIWREKFKKPLGGNNFKNFWREHFGGNIVAGNLKYFFHFEKSTKCSFFNKGSETEH